MAALLRASENSPVEIARRCDEAAFFISRMAARVPWRSDCIPSEIVVGAAKAANGQFNAHAWLRHGDRIVLGGDISRFQPLLEPDATVFK